MLCLLHVCMFTKLGLCVARRLAERRKSEEYEESDAEVVRQTAVEAEDVWDAELQTFHPASRSTGQSGDLSPSKHKELISCFPFCDAIF